MHEPQPPEETPRSPATADQPHRPARWFRATSASSIGIEIAVAVCVPTLAGRWADGHWPDFAPFGVVLGLVVGCGGAVRAVQRALADYKRELKNPSDPNESLFVPGSVGSMLHKVGQDAAAQDKADDHTLSGESNATKSPLEPK